MAASFSEIKHQVVLVLYDYMLTSDEEAFWYYVAAVREALPEDVSGAFVKRAIDALVSEDMLEREQGDDLQSVYALSDKGIEYAESLIRLKGIDLANYDPAPSADRIISRIAELETVTEIESGLIEIAAEIRENNELAVQLGDDRDLISAEIEAGQSLTKQDSFRLRSLMGLLMPGLRFLASHFAGDGVGELAKRLIQLLIKIN